MSLFTSSPPIMRDVLCGIGILGICDMCRLPHTIFDYSLDIYDYDINIFYFALFPPEGEEDFDILI